MIDINPNINEFGTINYNVKEGKAVTMYNLPICIQSLLTEFPMTAGPSAGVPIGMIELILYLSTDVYLEQL